MTFIHTECLHMKNFHFGLDFNLINLTLLDEIALIEISTDKKKLFKNSITFGDIIFLVG